MYVTAFWYSCKQSCHIFHLETETMGIIKSIFSFKQFNHVSSIFFQEINHMVNSQTQQNSRIKSKNTTEKSKC